MSILGMRQWSMDGPYVFGGGAATDPNIASVVLLCGFDGADGAAGASDESPSAKALTFAGNAQLDTAQSKFGPSSLLLDGSGDRVSAADSADFNLGSGRFTVELFVMPVSLVGQQFLVAQWNTSGTLGWVLSLNGAALNWNVSTTGSNNLTDLAAGTVTTGSFHHVAVDYDGTKYRLYLDGAMVASSSTPRTIFDSTQALTIGSNGGTSFYLNGWIDELRITKGVARYASDSGFAVPAAAFPRS